MAEEIDLPLLCQRWLHSHEEDTAEQMVFRPASFKFPPARGRDGFELRSDQSMIEIRIGPTDRVEEISGTWKIEGGNQLLFYEQTSPSPTRRIQIILAEEDRLVTKK
jgi:hypothetical protein